MIPEVVQANTKYFLIRKAVENPAAFQSTTAIMSAAFSLIK